MVKWLVIAMLASCATVPSAPAGNGLFALDGKAATWPGAYLDHPQTLIVFMTRWCEACERQHPEIEKWAATHAANVRTVVVASGSGVAEIQKMVEQRHMQLEVLVDADGALAERFAVQATPTFVLLGNEGRELARYRAAVELPATIDAQVTYQRVEDSGAELGTTYEAVLLTPSFDVERAKRDLARARELVHALDARLSEWKPDSEISRVNREAGAQAVAVSADLLQIARGSLHVAQVTGGAFDITWRPIGELWDEAGRRGRAPSPEELASALEAVGAKNVELSDTGVRFKNPKVKLGIGSSAKGWIVDQVFTMLSQAGYRQITVKIGGDLRTSGRDAEGRSTTFQLVDPYAPPKVVATIAVADVAIATSGNYFRGRQVGEHFVGHIFDPRTGLPPAFDGSVTVITHDAAMATSLSTGLFVLGPEAGMALAKTLEGVEVVYVTRDGLKSTLSASKQVSE